MCRRLYSKVLPLPLHLSDTKIRKRDEKSKLFQLKDVKVNVKKKAPAFNYMQMPSLCIMCYVFIFLTYRLVSYCSRSVLDEWLSVVCDNSNNFLDSNNVSDNSSNVDSNSNDSTDMYLRLSLSLAAPLPSHSSHTKRRTDRA
jgi:hypothetical protein